MDSERLWDTYTSGNGAPDREEFEAWALRQPGALRASDPDVYAWLLRVALAIEDAERAMGGEAVSDRTAASILREVTEKFRDSHEQNGTSRQHAEMLERFGQAEKRHGHTRHARIFDGASQEMLRRNGSVDVLIEGEVMHNGHPSGRIEKVAVQGERYRPRGSSSTL